MIDRRRCQYHSLLVSRRQTMNSVSFESGRTTLHIWSAFDRAPQTVVQNFGCFDLFQEMWSTCHWHSHIKFGKALLSFAHWNSMNPLYHGTTHNKYSPTEWNTNSSYAPPFYAPSSRTMTPPVHTTSPATYTTSTRLSPPQKRKQANDENSATSTASNHASAKIGEFLACISNLDTSISRLEQSLAKLMDELRTQSSSGK